MSTRQQAGQSNWAKIELDLCGLSWPTPIRRPQWKRPIEERMNHNEPSRPTGRVPLACLLNDRRSANNDNNSDRWHRTRLVRLPADRLKRSSSAMADRAFNWLGGTCMICAALMCLSGQFDRLVWNSKLRATFCLGHATVTMGIVASLGPADWQAGSPGAIPD